MRGTGSLVPCSEACRNNRFMSQILKIKPWKCLALGKCFHEEAANPSPQFFWTSRSTLSRVSCVDQLSHLKNVAGAARFRCPLMLGRWDFKDTFEFSKNTFLKNGDRCIFFGFARFVNSLGASFKMWFHVAEVSCVDENEAT